MCGIAGLWAPDLPAEAREALVGRMVARLAHRGPDGIALWSDGEATLGIARLAIVSPDAPARVFPNESARIHAVVNGEIYNHRELALDLERAGHLMAPGPDTTVVVHVYERYGADFPQRLDGMFAAAIWDSERRRLTLTRDRAGEKPLFTHRSAGRAAFASEPAALLVLPWVSREPAPEAIARYLVHGCFAGRDCAFAGLRQVAPATVVEMDERGERARVYWRPWDVLGLERRPRAIPAEIRATRDVLERAVASRVPDEMPFGVLLSGGLDSSLIAALASRTAPGFPTFSLGLEGHGYDESSYAREVARHLGTDHHELTMDEAAGREALEALAASTDQPLGDPSLIPTWYLARFAARHVPVVLTGEGGDELFAGYPTYLGHRYAGLAELLPGPVSAAALALARRARPRDRHLSVPYLIERFLAARGRAPFARHLAWFGNLEPREAQSLLAPGLAAAAGPEAPLGHLGALERELEAQGLGRLIVKPGVVGYQILDFLYALGGALLTKVDRSTMAHGMESRAPFLRPEMIEHAFALPDRLKLRGASGKWILKQVARDLLPPRIIQRRKQGFSPPFSAWARGPWRDEVRNVLSPERVAKAGVLAPQAAAAFAERHLAGAAETGRALWSLISLQLWAERWLVSPDVPESRRPAPPVRARRVLVPRAVAPSHRLAVE